MSESQTSRRLRALAASGHVEIRGTGYRILNGLEPIGHTYALEAKVSDWQKAISQALRYSTWCDTAAIVLLKPPRDLREVRARCANMGLGLAVRDRWVHRPKLGTPNKGLRLAASEQFARLVTESQAL